MNIKCVIVGLYRCNCYILEKDNKVLVIDPGDNYPKIKKEIGNGEVIGVLITHFHPDHVGALKYFDNDIYSINNLEEKEYHLGPFNFEVIYTKGHTDDSVTYYFKDEKVMFTGDFLFCEDIGRCDLPTGNMDVMKKSLEKIKMYDDDIVIYPGHEESSSLGHEKKYNYYLK